MYVNGRHWNTRKLVFAGTRIREPVQCRTRTRVYMNAALLLCFVYLGELRMSIRSRMCCDVRRSRTPVTSASMVVIRETSTWTDAGAICIIAAATTSSPESLDSSTSRCSRNDSSLTCTAHQCQIATVSNLRTEKQNLLFNNSGGYLLPMVCVNFVTLKACE